jgi:pimeloyl-ACP methyl ester carboxylesterase
MDRFQSKGAVFAYETRGKASGIPVVWGHGWGQDHSFFLPLAGSMRRGRHFLLDFPGFGKSPAPPKIWSTADYADALAEWIRQNFTSPIIWVGHSFGGRVGIQLAARHPELVAGLFLIAAAGLKRKRPLHKTIHLQGQVWTFKLLKNFVPMGMLDDDWLKKHFGSKDYQNAGPMRSIFVKVVNEDLTAQAKQIHCPVKLVYGSEDTEAPPEMGERFHKLMRNSEMISLEGEDHYTVLDSGRHQVAALLDKFIIDFED